MPKVWIPKNAGHSFESAKRFGEIEFIFDKNTSNYNPDTLYAIASERLLGFSEGDFLLFSGPPIVNAIAFHILMERVPKLTLLLYFPPENTYLVRNVNPCI